MTRNETSASGSGVAGSNQPVARFGRDSERRNAPPHRGGGHPPSPSSPLSMRERRRGARPAHSITPFCCCLFAYLFHRASCVPSRQRVQVPPSAPRALRERPRSIRTSLTSCGRKKQLWFRSFQLLLEYRQVNLLSRGGAVWAAAPPAYEGLAQSAEQAAHNGPVPGSSP